MHLTNRAACRSGMVGEIGCGPRRGRLSGSLAKLVGEVPADWKVSTYRTGKCSGCLSFRALRMCFAQSWEIQVFLTRLRSMSVKSWHDFCQHSPGSQTGATAPDGDCRISRRAGGRARHPGAAARLQPERREVCHSGMHWTAGLDPATEGRSMPPRELEEERGSHRRQQARPANDGPCRSTRSLLAAGCPPPHFLSYSPPISFLNCSKSTCMPLKMVLQWRVSAAIATASWISSSVAPARLASCVSDHMQ